MQKSKHKPNKQKTKRKKMPKYNRVKQRVLKNITELILHWLTTPGAEAFPLVCLNLPVMHHWRKVTFSFCGGVNH